MRNIARIKLGYYTLPQEEGKRLRKLLDFRPVQPASIHASAWENALHQLTDAAEAEKHVELDANRAVSERFKAISSTLLRTSRRFQFSISIFPKTPR